MNNSFLKALQQVASAIPGGATKTTTTNTNTNTTPSVNLLAQTQPYFQNLADAYKVQYDTQQNLLNEQRRQQMAGIMSQMNQAGMLNSNFGQRAQIQYDTNTYLPALAKAGTTYYTGLNDLRNKGTQLANNILTTQEAINDINKDIYAVS